MEQLHFGACHVHLALAEKWDTRTALCHERKEGVKIALVHNIVSQNKILRLVIRNKAVNLMQHPFGRFAANTRAYASEEEQKPHCPHQQPREVSIGRLTFSATCRETGDASSCSK